MTALVRFWTLVLTWWRGNHHEPPAVRPALEPEPEATQEAAPPERAPKLEAQPQPELTEEAQAESEPEAQAESEDKAKGESEPEPEPPFPGWRRSHDGEWVDPSCKFMHLEDLLDQIPICQKLVKALRHQYPAAYDYHRKLGARLLPSTLGTTWYLSSQAREILPSIGLVYWHERLGCRDADERVPLMFFFEKQEINAWTSYGTAYKIALSYWARFHKNSRRERRRPFAVGCVYTVIVDHAGKVRVVPEPTQITQTIRHHYPPERRRFSQPVTYVNHWQMAIPHLLRRCYEEACGHIPMAEREKAGLSSPEEWGAWLAVIAINLFTAGLEADQFVVMAERGGATVRFDAALASPKSFFADRGCSLAVDGRRRRIIHWVREHDRELADGRTVTVKGHFRGLTEFTWHGSNVTVLLPRNPADPRAFAVPLTEIEDEDELPSDMVEIGEIADMQLKALRRNDPKLSRQL